MYKAWGSEDYIKLNQYKFLLLISYHGKSNCIITLIQKAVSRHYLEHADEILKTIVRTKKRTTWQKQLPEL